jgi:hypothetical protein
LILKKMPSQILNKAHKPLFVIDLCLLPKFVFASRVLPG